MFALFSFRFQILSIKTSIKNLILYLMFSIFILSKFYFIRQLNYLQFPIKIIIFLTKRELNQYQLFFLLFYVCPENKLQAQKYKNKTIRFFYPFSFYIIFLFFKKPVSMVNLQFTKFFASFYHPLIFFFLPDSKNTCP